MKTLIPLNEFTTDPKEHVCEFINIALAATAKAHQLHLMALNRSYSLHKALEEFYEELPGLIDSFAEAHLSENELSFTEVPELSNDPDKLVQELLDTANALHTPLPPSLQNPLEDIMTQCRKTLYKIRKFV